ncbi:MAG: hypothetical protein ACR2H0_05980 [Candidatus Limnocylindrales bacterium]
MPLFEGEATAATFATEQLLVVALLALPIAGFALTALIGRRLYARAWMIAVPAMVLTWAIAMYLVYQALFVGAFGHEGLHFSSTTGSPPAASTWQSTSASTRSPPWCCSS